MPYQPLQHLCFIHNLHINLHFADKNIPKSFVSIYILFIFAACLRINARPKIVKKAENNEFLQLKNMNDTEIKEWQTQSVKHKVAMVLIMDGVCLR